ncbi:MAG: fibrobacter succinogenes major paralogous domain-containing protein [Bacteroidota bacterium]
MKKLLLISAMIALVLTCYSQAPQAFNYQAILRNSDGTPKANETVALQISIVNDLGVSSYLEIHNTQTNEFGLVNVAIGRGTSSDDLASVDWANGPYFIDIAVNGEAMGTSPLLSVPYALHASNVEDITEVDPLYSDWDKDYQDLINKPTQISDFALSANNDKIVNLANPTDPQDAATKSYVTLSVSVTGDTLYLGNDQWVIIPGISFANSADSIIRDYDGNIYQTVTLGNQTWMAENLKVTHYANGAAIPAIADGNINGSTDDEWAVLEDNNTSKAYCYYNDDAGSQYGALYTYGAVINGIPPIGNEMVQGVCPDDWHMPSDDEWKELEIYLGMSQSEADKSSCRGTDQGSQLASNAELWNSGNLENSANFDITGFKALPGGDRFHNTGESGDMGYTGLWWTSTEIDDIRSYVRAVYFNYTSICRYDFGGSNKSNGYSVRCVKDTP